MLSFYDNYSTKHMNRLVDYFFSSSTGVFTQADISVAISGTDFSRHGLVKRAIADGEIINVRRGLYCLAPKYQKNHISVYGLAEQIYGPSYISLESALSYHGWIPEAVYTCSCVSFGNAKEFKTPLGIFSYKRVPQHIFYSTVCRHEDESGNIFFMARPVKALTDYVYIHRLNWTSITQAAGNLRIDEDSFASVTSKELQELLGNYTNARVRKFLAGWLKEIES
jgi:hypothetical protein